MARPARPRTNDRGVNRLMAGFDRCDVRVTETHGAWSLKHHNARVIADDRCVARSGGLHWRSLSAETVSNNNRCDIIGYPDILPATCSQK